MANAKNKNLQIALAILTAAMCSSEALAGTGGSYIDTLWTFLNDSLQGGVGKVIAVSGLAYGLVAGVAKGSLAGLGIGLGLAAGAYYGPNAIKSINTAVLFMF